MLWDVPTGKILVGPQNGIVLIYINFKVVIEILELECEA